MYIPDEFMFKFTFVIKRVKNCGLTDIQNTETCSLINDYSVRVIDFIKMLVALNPVILYVYMFDKLNVKRIMVVAPIKWALEVIRGVK